MLNDLMNKTHCGNCQKTFLPDEKGRGIIRIENRNSQKFLMSFYTVCASCKNSYLMFGPDGVPNAKEDARLEFLAK